MKHVNVLCKEYLRVWFPGIMNFLFCICRPKDIGRAKAVAAAEFINSRVAGCNVTPYPLTLCLASVKLLVYFIDLRDYL